MSAPSRERAPPAWSLALVLALVVLILYARTAQHDFLTYDDGSYLTENPNVRRGLSWEAARWALVGFHSANWHPLTWLSHQLDVSLFGLSPGPHHLESAGLHALSAILCFVFFLRATGASWPAFLVALLFAVHPLRVESVAWASERKDVLAGLFFFATLLAHERYVRAPSRRRAVWVWCALALGLLSKPMLVTVPVVLWLVDVWPLARGQRTRRGAPGLGMAALAPSLETPSLAPTHPGETTGGGGGFGGWLERGPLVALALGSALVTVLAQRAGGAVRSVEVLSLADRLATALVGTATYVRQTVWPSGLAFFYPHPALVGTKDFSLASPRVVLSTLVLLAITGLALALRRRAPAIGVGWCWMLVMLVPVIGFVQVGAQLHADRYAYLPTLGLTFALVYGARALFPAWRRALFGLGLSAAVLLAGVTWRQVATWHDIRTLCQRALAVTHDNYVALEHLGVAEQRAGNLPAARAAYEAALSVAPLLHDARSNLGAVFLDLDQPERAIACFREALRIRPDFLEAQLNWGQLEERRGDYAAALERYAAAAAQHPGSSAAWRKVGDAALALADFERAAASYARALDLGGEVDARAGLAWALLEQGHLEDARAELLRVLALAPEHTVGTHLLAYLEAAARDPALRDPAAAAQRLARCARRGPENWLHERAEAAVRAAEGAFSEAVSLAISSAADAPRFAWPALKTERETYRAGRALERP